MSEQIESSVVIELGHGEPTILHLIEQLGLQDLLSFVKRDDLALAAAVGELNL